jgi:hypothetical protein
MFRVRVTSLDKRDLMLEPRLVRRHLQDELWEYFSIAGWFNTLAEAEAKAAPYCERNLRVEIIWLGLDPREQRVVRLVRDIEPQEVYEAKRALNPPPSEKPVLLRLIGAAFSKLGTGFQLLFFFLLAIAPIAGTNGERWDIALMIGVAAVVVFMFGKHMGKEKAKGNPRRA